MLKDGVIGMSDNFWNCEYFSRCQNNAHCMKCGTSQRMLKMKEDKARKQQQAKTKIVTKEFTPQSDNSGATLEEYVRDHLNAIPTIKEYWGRRTRGSGNLWFDPGDVNDIVLLVECKERATINSKGEKAISITKTMLEKILHESKGTGKYPAFAFRLKNDPSGRTYMVNEFGVICEMVHEIKILRHEYKTKEAEADMWKASAEELFKELEALKKKLKA